MKQPKRPFVVEIKPSRTKMRQQERASIWGKIDISGATRAIVVQEASEAGAHHDPNSGEKPGPLASDRR